MGGIPSVHHINDALLLAWQHFIGFSDVIRILFHLLFFIIVTGRTRTYKYADGNAEEYADFLIH
jgi:hypothetical protein